MKNKNQLKDFIYLDQLEEIRHRVIEAEAMLRDGEFIDCIEEIDKIIDTLDTYEAEEKAKKFVIEWSKMMDWQAILEYEFTPIKPEVPILTFRFDPKYQYDWTIMQEQVCYTEVKKFKDRNVIQEKVCSLDQWNKRVDEDMAECYVESQRWARRLEPTEIYNPVIVTEKKINLFLRK